MSQSMASANIVLYLLLTAATVSSQQCGDYYGPCPPWNQRYRVARPDGALIPIVYQTEKQWWAYYQNLGVQCDSTPDKLPKCPGRGDICRFNDGFTCGKPQAAGSYIPAGVPRKGRTGSPAASACEQQCTNQQLNALYKDAGKAGVAHPHNDAILYPEAHPYPGCSGYKPCRKWLNSVSQQYRACQKSCGGNKRRTVEWQYEGQEDDDAWVVSKNWVLGAAGQSCDMACATERKGCDGAALEHLHSAKEGIDEKQAGRMQLDAFLEFGIDCDCWATKDENCTSSTTVVTMETSSVYPAFSKFHFADSGLSECLVTPAVDTCKGDSGCLCELEPVMGEPQGEGDEAHPIHRLCACSAAQDAVDASTARLQTKGLTYTPYGLVFRDPLTPDAGSSTDKEDCTGAAAASRAGASGAVDVLAVLVAVLGLGCMALLLVLYRQKNEKKLPGVKQMQDAA